MVGSNYIKLVTIKAADEDTGKGIARLHSGAMRSLGIVNGEMIDIRGHKNVPAVAWNTQNAYQQRIEIAMDGEMRRNAGCGINDTVLIRKACVHDAEKIILQPITSIKLNNSDIFIAKKLRGRPVISGQTIKIDLIGNSISFIVTKVVPHGIGIVTFSTEIENVEIAYKEEIPDEKIYSIHYEDIGGLSREISLIREMVELPLRFPQIFERIGIDPPKGVLLYGPPGTGKTLLACAVATEVEAYFITLSGPEVMSRYYGDSEKRIREIFELAEKKAPSIIFIDEIDSIAPKRQETFGEVERRVTAQLLTMMDGLSKRGQVVVIAATNIPESIDPALRRGGRFDREIEIGIPDKTERLEIYRVHTRTMPLCKDVVLEDWADTSYGFVGADIALHCKEAAMHAIRNGMDEYNRDDKFCFELIKQLMISSDDFTAARRIVEPSGMRELRVEIPDVSWDQVAGLTEIKQEILKIIEWPSKVPDLYSKLHLKPPKGILLFGPPGAGKTLLVKAIANRTHMNFISIKGPELLSRLVGDSEKKVREAFRKARQAAPSLLFFDEIDSLVHRRGLDGPLSRVTESVLSQILTELDGIEELSDVIVIAATNRPDMLDPAIIRAGRLEKHIYVPAPDRKEREEILNLYLSDITHLLSPDISIPSIAEKMRFYVGADIEAFVRELKQIALSDHMGNFQNNHSLPDTNQILIQNKHIIKALMSGKGTLDDRTLEAFEQSGWALLYSKSYQDFLNHAVSVIIEADHCCDEEINPEMREMVLNLRESVFWNRKDLSHIQNSIQQLQRMCTHNTR